MKFLLMLCAFLPFFANAEPGGPELVSSQNQFREYRYLVSLDGSSLNKEPVSVRVKLKGALSLVDCHVVGVTAELVPIGDSQESQFVKLTYHRDGLEYGCVDRKVVSLSTQWLKRVDFAGSSFSVIVPEGITPEIIVYPR